MLPARAIPKIKAPSAAPWVPGAFGGFCCFSHITLRTDSLRMILWMASTMRKSPPSFLRMLTAYPGQMCRLRPEGKRPGLSRSSQKLRGFLERGIWKHPKLRDLFPSSQRRFKVSPTGADLGKLPSSQGNRDDPVGGKVPAPTCASAGWWPGQAQRNVSQPGSCSGFSSP